MLGSGASIFLLGANDTKPADCVAQAVNANAACYLLVKGRVDIDADIEKAKRSWQRQVRVLICRERLWRGWRR